MKMKKVYFLFISSLLLIACSEDLMSPSMSPTDVVESLWKYANENYVYFDFKSVDWEAKRSEYLAKVDDDISADSLFTVCADMIGELKDGHNYLKFDDRIYQYDYTDGFDVNFSLDLVQSKYLQDEFQTEESLTYGIINDTIGYVYYEKFKSALPWETVMAFFPDQGVTKIIIDLRNNSGGLPETAQSIAGYFVDEPTLIGYITHKNGKGPNDFSEKLEIEAVPQAVYFDNNVNILINRGSFSASSYLAGMTTALSNVTLIGQITGGGGGAEAAFELPNGWIVGITSNFFQDSQDRQIEDGVRPMIDIVNSAADISSEVDRMLEVAIEN